MVSAPGHDNTKRLEQRCRLQPKKSHQAAVTTAPRAYMTLLHLQASPWLALTTEGFEAAILLVEINDIQ